MDAITADVLSALIGLEKVQEFHPRALPNLLTLNMYKTWDAVKYYRSARNLVPPCDVENCVERAVGMWRDDQRRGLQLCAQHAPKG